MIRRSPKADVVCICILDDNGGMSQRFLGRSAVTLIIMLLLNANRPVPEWQGFSNRPIGFTTRCAARVLSQFGDVVSETGRNPEGGLIRLMLRAAPDTKRSPPVLMAYFDGDANFSSVFMEASNRRVANAVWRGFKRQCGLPHGS
ncbi:hypothetical protein ASE85_07795 [Sphingobium sp. Leaf26]|nr:hypothetical protein ASE85_07795 [Sphingobium sp. Leaf26]